MDNCKDEQLKEIPAEMAKTMNEERVFNIVRLLNEMGARFDVEYEGIRYTSTNRRDKL